jgi:PAS domain S-box-containing protein
MPKRRSRPPAPRQRKTDSKPTAERRYQKLVEHSTDGLVLLSAEGRILYVSPAVRGILGFAPTALVGRGLMELIHPDDAAAVSEGMSSVLRRPGSTVELQARARRADGAWCPCDGTLTNRCRDPDVRAVVANFRDASERLRAEEQVRQLERRLNHVQRMDAIGRLAGGVAHDFNNLLTAILGYSEILLEDLDPAHPHKHELEEIRRAADRASSLTRQLLAFSRRQMLQPRVIDLNAVLEDMWTMVERVVGSNVQPVRELAPGLGRVRADPAQLEQVILNLVLNARDAMPGGGRLTITTADRDVRDRFEAGDFVEPGAYVSLAVQDTGVGMEPETRDRVFEPFFTTKDRSSGLGLSTVYGIVKQSMGFITVTSDKGRGSRFEVLLPRVEAAAESPALDAAPGSRPERRPTILLVEDEAAVRRLTARILRREDYTVLEAGDGVDALEVAARHEGPIDLLITDVVMPRMGGREAAERLTAARPDLKVLFMSAYARDELGPHGLLVPGLVLLHKPFEIQDLTAKVRALLRGAAA